MNLHPLQRSLLRHLESIPTGISEFASVSLFERGRLRAGKLVTDGLRSLRRGAPMNWDPWILQDGNLYRLFYLQGIEGKIPWWTVSNLCAAVSPDLQHWHDLGTILEPVPDRAWESGRISAGCTFKADGIYYLFYSAGGSELPDLKNEGIGLATSVDGRQWQRQYDHYPLQPTEHDPWYGRCNWTQHFHWRDPYIFHDPQDDRYYMFTCASSKTPGNFQGCIGLAVADRVAGPYQLLPPAVATSIQGAADWPFYHMERPQVFYKQGKYHLLFSCFRMFLNPDWLQRVNANRITNSTLYWYVADRVTGPYQPNREWIVTNSETTGLYGANLLPTSAELDEFIAYGWYHRLHTLEVSRAFRANWHATGLTVLPPDRSSQLASRPKTSAKIGRFSHPS